MISMQLCDVWNISMMTSSNENFFPRYWRYVLPSQKPVTQSFDVLFDLHLNNRLSKQPTRR